MDRDHSRHVEAQFGPRAAEYVSSAVHAGGPDLEALAELAAAAAPARALDLGTGGGHVAYLLAAHAGTVTAADLSAQMLSAVAATAAARGIDNIVPVETAAERLPFPDASFDFVASRYSAHHWHDLDQGLREARRVLAPEGRAVFMDAFAPARPLLDTHLQAVELLRDTSHVRDYGLGEWLTALGRAGFAIRAVRTFRLRLDFPSWIARMRTPAPLVAAIRALQAAAPAEVGAHFAIEPDGSFRLDTLLIEAGPQVLPQCSSPATL